LYIAFTEFRGLDLNSQTNAGDSSSLGDEQLILELQAHGGKVRYLDGFLIYWGILDIDSKFNK